MSSKYELIVFEMDKHRGLTGEEDSILLPPRFRTVDKEEWLRRVTPFNWRAEKIKDPTYAAVQHQIHFEPGDGPASNAQQRHELARDTPAGGDLSNQGAAALGSNDFHIAIKGAGDGLGYKDAATMTRIAHRIYDKINEMVGPDFTGKKCLLGDGDWLKPQSCSAMLAHMVDLFPDLHLHIVRTCPTTHLKFLHSTTADEKATVAKKETWYEFFTRIAPVAGEPADARITVSHAAAMPEDTCSGQRNTKFANLVVYIGGGLECEKEVGSLIFRPDPLRKRKIDKVEGAAEATGDPNSSLVAANVVL